MEFRAQSWDYMNSVKIAAFVENFERRYIAKPVVSEMAPYGEGTLGEATMTLDMKDAQSLMDALYSCGLRPRDAKPQDKTIEAMSYHLEDMRRLVFKGK